MMTCKFILQSYKQLQMLKRSLFAFSLPPIVLISYIGVKSRTSKENRLNVVFDLDATLIDSAKYKHIKYSNMVNTKKHHHVLKSDNQIKQYYVWKRPFCITSLALLSNFNNLHLFTRATQDYADEICENLDINKYLDSKHYRSSCSECKDLHEILDKSKIKILVDDNMINKCDDQHFYHIPEYSLHKQYDFELLKVFFYVLKCNIVNDIKEVKKLIC